VRCSATYLVVRIRLRVEVVSEPGAYPSIRIVALVPVAYGSPFSNARDSGIGASKLERVHQEVNIQPQGKKRTTTWCNPSKKSMEYLRKSHEDSTVIENLHSPWIQCRRNEAIDFIEDGGSPFPDTTVMTHAFIFLQTRCGATSEP
jgi:hypothetical protein